MTDNFMLINILKYFIMANKSIGKFYVKIFPNSIFSLENVLIEILYVLKTGIPWRDLRSTIKWQTVYYHFKRFTKNNIFKRLFFNLRKKYINKVNTNILSIDSTFIPNKFGKNKVKRNKFYKNKKCNKISIVADSIGIPVSIIIDKGTIHDSKFFYKHIKDIHIIQNNKCKYFLGDKAYVSNKIRTLLNSFNCKLITPKKSNSNKNHFFDKTIYKKRIFVEHAFQKFKSNRRIDSRYESLFSTYYSFVYLGACKILANKI